MHALEDVHNVSLIDEAERLRKAGELLLNLYEKEYLHVQVSHHPGTLGMYYLKAPRVYVEVLVQEGYLESLVLEREAWLEEHLQKQVVETVQASFYDDVITLEEVLLGLAKEDELLKDLNPEWLEELLIPYLTEDGMYSFQEDYA